MSLDPLRGEHRWGAVRAVHEDSVPPAQVGEAKEDRWPALGVHVSGDHRWAAFAGFWAVAPPSGDVVGVRWRQNPILVDGEGLDRRIDPDRRDPDAHRVMWRRRSTAPDEHD